MARDHFLETAMPIAFVRTVSESIHNCELTHMDQETIDLDHARSQHATYVDALRLLGCEIQQLPQLDHQPDAVFVEDTAVVVPELAILTNPGAASRRGEVDTVGEALAEFRPVVRLTNDGNLEGGDVLRIENQVHVGCASRTNEAGILELRSHLEPLGYDVITIRHGEALHLKTACTYLGDGVLLLNRNWVDIEDFDELEPLECHPDEPFACNAIRLGDSVLFPEEFIQTRKRIEARGFNVHPVPASELAKAEGGLTCSSIIID
ncbi:MAG: arginine deiminase family protein [Phycisphaerales bacterium]|nr:arginine deiminase family protein [Phycisphaerales bacterium]